MEKDRNRYFLLGGHDLEMLTIRDLLNKKGLPYSDHHLRWDNAQLSQYAETIEKLSPEQTIYGIELQEDIQPPVNYHKIDHHNQYSHLPSALEQVAQILQMPISRKMQLIAANDKAYIPGLTAIGATQEEIEEIRKADRHAQGVTEVDEQLAEKAISENIRQKGKLTIIKALSPRFSPICDRLYPYKKLLIYTDNEWIYYGIGTDGILKLFQQEQREGKLFYGGGPDGYIGIKERTCTVEEIEKMITIIIDLEYGK